MSAGERFHEARVLAGTGRLSEATAALDALLAEDPSHEGALLLRASMYGEERDWPAALRLYEQAADRWPASAEAHNALARCLHAMGKDAEAIERAETARSLLHLGDNFRQVAAVYLTLVWCHRELRQFQEALDLAEEGLARVPDAVLAQWASQIEQELLLAQQEEC